MNGFKKGWLLLYLMSKRLYKKVSFLIILVCLVLVTVFMSVALKQQSSMLKIAIVNFDHNQNEIISSLLKSNGAVSYKLYSENDADKLLKEGKVDSVWQFSDNFDKKFSDYIAEKSEQSPIKIILREKNTFINLSLERVYAELYPAVAESFYYRYGAKEVSQADKQLLKDYYKAVERNDDIVSFSYYNSDQKVEHNNYLVTPLRGVLAVIMIFCGMASALYFLNDCENGNMDAIPINKRWLLQVVYIVAGTVNIAFFVMVALALSGLMGNFLTECLVMLLYILATVGFAGVISGITAKSVRMASVMPILSMAILGVCPIFLNFKIPFAPKLFPTYWYLTAVYNTSVIPKMLIYCLLVWLLSFVIWKKRRYAK